MFYGMRSAGKALTKVGMVDFATAIAPGLSDVLVTGKATEAARRRAGAAGSRYAYDAVVMDAPPTGRIGRFLNVTTEVSDLAKVGPIRTHADTVANVIRSPQTAVHFVCTLEEMPVQETLDGIAELREIKGIQVGGVIVNMARPALLARTTSMADPDLPALGRGAHGGRAARDRAARRGPRGRAGRARCAGSSCRTGSAPSSTRRGSRSTSCR